MRILLVNDYATPVGGVEILVLMLRDRLRERGHEVRVFASSARPGGGEGFADYECFGTTSRFRTLLQTANPWAHWRLRRVLAAFQPEVVHVLLHLTQLSPLILPLLRNVPSVFHAQWYRAVCPLGTKMFPDGQTCHVPWGTVCYHTHCLPLRDWVPLMVQMRLWRQWRQAFNRVVAVSTAVQRSLIAEGIAPVDVIWNGIPPQRSRPPLVSPPTAAFAGRFVREKGIDVLLRAFAKVVAAIPEARLVLVGDGPERLPLHRLIADLGLSTRVSIAGHLPRQELEQYLAKAWVQVVPSRWSEPFGLVAAEAMMRGTAVIASDTGGLMEIVQDGDTGFLVPPGDPEALATRLLQVLHDRDLAEHLGQAGRTMALACLSETTVVDRFVEVYQQLIEQKDMQGKGKVT
jgi:glycosyltransferase involved in cell wall biosynthesis